MKSHLIFLMFTLFFIATYYFPVLINAKNVEYHSPYDLDINFNKTSVAIIIAAFDAVETGYVLSYYTDYFIHRPFFIITMMNIVFWIAFLYCKSFTYATPKNYQTVLHYWALWLALPTLRIVYLSSFLTDWKLRHTYGTIIKDRPKFNRMIESIVRVALASSAFFLVYYLKFGKLEKIFCVVTLFLFVWATEMLSAPTIRPLPNFDHIIIFDSKNIHMAIIRLAIIFLGVSFAYYFKFNNMQMMTCVAILLILNWFIRELRSTFSNRMRLFFFIWGIFAVTLRFLITMGLYDYCHERGLWSI